jgi:hypothetical protein
LRIKGIGLGLLVAVGSLAWAGASFAGVLGADMRLNGIFEFEDDAQSDDNEACLTATGGAFRITGRVVGTAGACTVLIAYDSLLPNKGGGTVLKDDDSGTAKVSQQVETRVEVAVIGLGCATPFGPVLAFPEKCKASGSVKAVEPSETVDSAKASLSCDLGENLSELDSPSEATVETIAAAFADRSDVKLSSNGKLTIKTKGVPNTGAHFCAPPT